MQKIYATRGGDDFVILSIDTANRADLDADFVKKVGATFPIALDDRKLSRDLFKIQGTPTNFVIGRDGQIIFRHLGFAPGGEKVLDAEIETLVGKERKPA